MNRIKSASISPEKQSTSAIKLAEDKIVIMDHYGNIKTTDHLKTFMSFICDRQSMEMSTVIRSSLALFNYCIPSREAVLAFYGDLFSEYSVYHWILKKRSVTIQQGDQNKSRIEYAGELTRRFYDMARLKLADAREEQMSDCGTNIQTPLQAPSSPTKNILAIDTGPASPTTSQGCQSPTNRPKVIPTGPRVIPTSRRTSSCNSNDMDQTPMSPSAQDSDASVDKSIHFDSDTNAIDIFSEFEEMIALIKTSLDNLISKYHLKESSDNASISTSFDRKRLRLRNTLTNWACDLLVVLNMKHSQTASSIAVELKKSNPSTMLKTEIDLWLANPVNKLLVDIILESHGSIQSLFSRLVSSTHNCDWLLAYILLEMSKRKNYDQEFAACLENLIGSQSTSSSVTHILAYLSDTNPKAMANFPKSNIPFLISLCQTSTSLLNVLCLEISDKIDPEFLNNLAGEVYSRLDDKTTPPCIESLTHCIMAAPNSYKLFLLALDVKLDSRVNAKVKTAAQLITDSISIKIHERAIEKMNNQQASMITRPIDNLLNQITNDLPKLIQKSLESKVIARKAHEILYRMSMIYDHTFASRVICHYLNLPNESFWPLLKPILTRYMKHFGDDGSTLVSQTLSLDADSKTENYWSNLNKLALLLPEMKLNLDLLSQMLVDRLCALTYDFSSIGQLIDSCCESLKRVDHDRISIRTKHRLCKSIATSYFLLLEYDGDNFPEILSYIRISLTCMSLLKQSSVASHILCRALLERSLVYGHLFNEKFNSHLIGDDDELNDIRQEELVRLSKENLKVTLGHRFRRLPNHLIERSNKRENNFSNNESKDDSKPDKQSINSYLLIEAFKSSINNIEAFANLFVEFHCPVMFDKHLWPNDDALRVINEKNLSILRKFEQVPPFWDLYELIGQSGCLRLCLVLVKALLAAHLALWASATVKSSPDKTNSTARLIPPLAQSGLIPKAFGLAVEVFPNLTSSEVFSVLTDIWQYLKDTNFNGSTDTDLSEDDKKKRAKIYLNRLRLFMCQHTPGPLYVKIFKEYCMPQVTTEIPTANK